MDVRADTQDTLVCIQHLSALNACASYLRIRLNQSLALLSGGALPSSVAAGIKAANTPAAAAASTPAGTAATTSVTPA